MFPCLLCCPAGAGGVIEQQINLYQDRFRGKMVVVSAAQLTILTLILIICMLGYSVSMQLQLNEAKATNISLKEQQQSVVDELNLANVELSRLLADTRMDDQIFNVTREIRARNKVLNFVESNQFGSGRGFSDYLISLSNLHVDNVWLDEIKIAENYVRIHGSSLNAELIPTYFERFSHESVFEGNRFDIFRLERKEATDWKVDFEIATREVIND